MKSVQGFLDYLKMLNRRQDTITRYGQVVREYLEYSNDKVSDERIQEFLIHKTKQGVSGTYRRLLYYALLAFIKYAKPGFQKFSFPLPKGEEPKRIAFTEREMLLMLDKAKERSNRDYLILRLLMMCGVRRSSLRLINPKIKGVLTKTAEGYILNVIHSKHDSYKTPIDTETVKLLINWKPKARKTPLAETEKAPWELSKDGISKVVSHYKKLCRIKKAGAACHAYRRGYATVRTRGGTSISELQKDLGHKSAATTLLYPQPQLEERQRTYKRTLPGAEK